MGIAATLKENYLREKAHLQGQGRSHARMIKQVKDIAGLELAHESGAPRAIPHAGVRMHDGKPMVFFTDGSLRHALGKKTTKAARKMLKRARRAQKSS